MEEDYYSIQARGIAASFVTAGLIEGHNAHKAEALLRVALEARFSAENAIKHIVGIADLSIDTVFDHISGVNETPLQPVST